MFLTVLSSWEVCLHCHAKYGMVMLGKEVMTLTKEKGRVPAWVMTVLGALWLGFFPLWQDGSYTRITRAKWLGMLGLSGLTAAAVFVIVIALLIRREGKKIRLHPIQGLALAYLAWVLLSACCGSMASSINDNGQLTVWMGARRYEGALTLSCYVGVFLLMSLYPPRLRVVLNVASLGMLIYATIVALQYLGHNPFGLFPAPLNVRTTYEFQGPIGNIDMVSNYVCLIMPALLFSFVLNRTGLLCLLAGSVGMLMLLMMEVQSSEITLAVVLGALVILMLLRPKTRGRGCVALACALAMLTLRLLTGLPWLDGTEDLLFPFAPAVWKFAPLMVAALLLLLAAWLSRRPGPAAPVWCVVLLVALGIAAALAAVLLISFPEGSALWELGEVLHGRPQDSFGSERLGIWRLTLELAQRSLIFGTGPDAFWYAMPEYMIETNQQVLWQRFDNPHNMLLTVLSGSGVPALLLYIALMAAMTVVCLRASRRDPLSLALLAGLAAYQLQGLFTFSICLVSPMFWALLGIALSRIRRQEVLIDAN